MLLRCTPGPVRLLGCPPRLLKLGPKCVFQSEEENDPKVGEHILRVMHESIPFSVRLITPPDVDFDGEMVNYVPQEYIQSAQESHRYSMTHIMKRLSAAK